MLILRKTLLLSLLLSLLALPAQGKDPTPSNDNGAAKSNATADGVLKVTAKPLKIDTGLVRGLVLGEANDIHLYRGIPFATPPVKELRWKTPQPPKAWDGVRECYTFGAAAPQKVVPLLSTFAGMGLDAPMSEDCLYLNVWAPTAREHGPLPVMVWIHGGGYTMGAGSQRLYEATDLARRGAVIVSINYRLGPFGFLAHPQLSAENEHGVSGNYGILDQIEALRWVQRNIAAFGGDPNRVTIFGESAGGGSVFSLLSSPLAKGLFHRAIAQSGPALNFAHLKKTHYGFQSAEDAGVEYATSCGAPAGEGQLAALRAMNSDQLLKTAPSLEGGGARTFTMRANMLKQAPVVDGYVLPDDVMTILTEGRQNPVPLIVGANKDEASIFSLVAVMPKGVEELKAALEKNMGVQLAEEMFEIYPTKTASDVRRTVTELMGDFIFVAPARFVASSMRHAKAPAYMYHFAHPPAGVTGRSFGAHHGAEVAYVLGNLELAGSDVTPNDEEIASALANYWVQFAATGNPNRDGLPAWPQYDPSTDQCLLVNDKITVEQGLRKARLDVMDAFMEAWRKETGVSSGK